MNKTLLIVAAGLLLSAAAFCGFYRAGVESRRELLREPKPELAWLRQEFRLSRAEFARFLKLREAYVPQCAQRCRTIAAQNAKLRQLLARSTTVSPAIQTLLGERARTRAECEAAMLTHFYEVSRAIPPREGRSYLEWVQSQTCLSEPGMEKVPRMAEQHD